MIDSRYYFLYIENKFTSIFIYTNAKCMKYEKDDTNNMYGNEL